MNPVIAITARDLETEEYIIEVIKEAKKKGILKGYDFLFTYEGEAEINTLEQKIIEKARELAKEIIKELEVKS